MRRSIEEIIIDLLIFTSCRHPSTKSIGKLSEIDIRNLLNNSFCGREFLNMLINYQYNNVSKQNYKIVVSNESYKKLQIFLKGLLNKRTIGNSLKVIIPLLRYLTVLTQHDVILLKKVDKKYANKKCKLKGYHKNEYCELLIALIESLNISNFMCGIFCVDKTFNVDHILKVAKNFGKMLYVNSLCKFDNIEIIQVEK